MNYRQLIKQNPILKKLITIQFFSYFGAWFSSVGIYSMLLDWGASALLVSFISATHFLPAFVLAPFVGGLVDRVRAKPLMMILLIVEFFMTCGFLLVNSLDDIYLLFILLFIKMSCSAIFFTCEMSLFPKILSTQALLKVNEIHSVVWSVSFASGMAIGGVVVHYFGVKIAFIVDALFFIFAIILLNKTFFTDTLPTINEKFLQSIKSGLSYIKQNKILIHLILLHSSIGFLAFDALVALLANYHYKYIISISLAIGLINGFKAIGIMIGPLFISRLITNDTLFYVFLMQGFMVILWAFIQTNFYFSLIGVFILGMPTAILWSYTYSLLQAKTSHKFLGRVLAYNEMAFMLLNVLTSLFIGYASYYISFFAISIILGLCVIGTGFYYLSIVRLLKPTS
jgi:MFS family permease